LLRLALSVASQLHFGKLKTWTKESYCNLLPMNA